MDPYIARVAADHRAAAQLHLGWMLDLLRLEVGLVEVVPRDEYADDGLPLRRLRRITRPAPTPAPDPRRPRMVPIGDGRAVIVRDVIPGASPTAAGPAKRDTTRGA